MYAIIMEKSGKGNFPLDNDQLTILSVHKERMASCLDAEIEAIRLNEKLGLSLDGMGGFIIPADTLFAEVVDQEWLDLNRPS
jgi:hypothetical protein